MRRYTPIKWSWDCGCPSGNSQGEGWSRRMAQSSRSHFVYRDRFWYRLFSILEWWVAFECGVRVRRVRSESSCLLTNINNNNNNNNNDSFHIFFSLLFLNRFFQKQQNQQFPKSFFSFIFFNELMNEWMSFHTKSIKSYSISTTRTTTIFIYFFSLLFLNRFFQKQQNQQFSKYFFSFIFLNELMNEWMSFHTKSINTILIIVVFCV